MANIDVVHTPVGNLLFYGVEKAVGLGCPNQRTDVLLVQYLLKVNCAMPEFAAIQTGAGFVASEMVINGIWDQYWTGYLANYLRTIARKGRGVVTDRRVDPVVGGQAKGPIHHMQYTILYLNLGYLSARPADFPRMAEVADCPADLRTELAVKFVH